MLRFLFVTLFLLLILLAQIPFTENHAWAVQGPDPDFEQQILPIFQKHCFACHDTKKQKSGLQLDVKSKAFAGGESGKPAIKPGDAGSSELYRRLITTDSEEVMPPTKEKLTRQQVELIQKWIDAGAVWPEHLANEKSKTVHWAYVPPVRPSLPVVAHSTWPRNPIDNFILARLEQEGLKPSPEADKTTLLRRLHLDLIGLPPTVTEIENFLKDTSAEAYSKVVDRLLASPHYGERWGRHWLDAARYADSDGYEKDKSRQIWFYRDWVIQAHNRDLPYDQFLREQLAGDQIPQPTQDQIVATGFLRNSMLNEEGGVDPEQFRMDAMFDRMDAIGKSMLGITIQCAQCHNHKYDPMSQEEYYRLFAFLNNDHEAQQVVYSPSELMQVNALQQQMKQIEQGLQERTADWKEKLAAWEQQIREQSVPWVVLSKLENAGDNGQRYIPQTDGSILAQGYAPTKFDTHLRGPV
ncbi:MAG TPA: DUF1549 domain-containing protein, partial [Gemmatales bacterium]|nr:DUF1549 domain-containing protein [Gemmatales bacterium]